MLGCDVPNYVFNEVVGTVPGHTVINEKEIWTQLLNIIHMVSADTEFHVNRILHPLYSPKKP